MKKRVLSLFFLLILGYRALGQTSIYYPFPQCYAAWTESSSTVIGPTNSYYTYYLSGDTLVNGYLHSKVYYADSTINIFEAAIRQDNSKHIYVCCGHGYGSNDKLLYDFNLTVGKPVPVGAIAGGYTVCCSDSILIDTTYRRRFTVSYGSGSADLIEGIGCSMGLFEFTTGLGYHCNLDCFSQNGATLYPTYGAPCKIFKWDTATCAPFVAGTEILNPIINFTIYPNPANDALNLSSLNISKKEKDVRIYSPMGELVYENHIPANANNYKIDVSNLATGLYCITISNDDGQVIKKVMIVR
jgi:hypothetical protein